MSVVLTEDLYRVALEHLAAHDAGLARLLERWGIPPFWTHEPGFPGIVLAILAQQVSVESASAAFDRLVEQIGTLNPASFLALDDAQLKAIGFSRQKASYARDIARGIVKGQVDLDQLQDLDDQVARDRLLECRGIGPWTADTYLLFSLRRADAWPSRDLALARAIQEMNEWPEMPTWDEADRSAESWRPFRAVAARILWHHYLRDRGRHVPA